MIPLKGSISSPQSLDSDAYSYPLSHYISSNKFSPGYKAFLARIIADIETFQFAEVVPYSHWREDMRNEIDDLERNHTWSSTFLSLGKKALECKWIHKIKRKLDRNI